MKVGDTVRLVSIPHWLIHDLPNQEQREIVDFIGQTAVITEVDNHGNFWLGFGTYSEDQAETSYSGHSFCVTEASLEKL